MRSSRYCMSSGDGSTGLNATSVMWLPMSPARPFHHDAAKRVEATADFLVHHRTQRVGEFPGRNDCESESRVKRQVPWHVRKVVSVTDAYPWLSAHSQTRRTSAAPRPRRP